MAEKTKQSETGEPEAGPVIHAAESQGQRWIKYGSNVVISTLVVIALAVLLVWLAQARDLRQDTTIGGTQSLRPQTIDFLKNYQLKTQIVALYPKLKTESGEQDFYQPVADLLAEYSSRNSNITTEMIDPDTQKDQFNKLVAEVTNKYGGEVKAYKAILDDLPAQSKIVGNFAKAEAQLFAAQPFDKVQDQKLIQSINTAAILLLAISQDASQVNAAVQADLDQQIPSYKDGTDDAKEGYKNLAPLLGQFSQVMGSFAANQAFANSVREYATGAKNRADRAAKVVNALLDRMNHLAPIKELEEFKSQLKSKSIIVMTDNGYKILSSDQVWKKVPQSEMIYAAGSEAPSRLSFAGEEQITAALSLVSSGEKPLVVFVRPGGPPLTSSPTGQGMYGAVAQRLRDYDFEVMEKDASGMPSQEELPMPEPTDAQMKKAIWVVLRAPNDSQPGQPSPLDAMLAEHLQSGGSALVMLFPQADPMDQALSPWGIKGQTSLMLVHQPRTVSAGQSADPLAGIWAVQYLFMMNHYGDHPIAKPLQGLDLLMTPCAPVMIENPLPPGETAAPLLPVPRPPEAPHSWASAEAQQMLQPGFRGVVTYHATADPDNGILAPDIDNTQANPLYCAAAAEKKDGARLVVVGSFYLAVSDLVDMPDQEMLAKHGLNVSRLPGNGEFFVNSIFWLAHMDNMLAISPHALQMARIEAAPGTLKFWRLGVFTVGLPLAVVVAGLLVYVRRRD